MKVPSELSDQFVTARQIVELIRQNIGVPWREATVDTFKSGNPDTPVTGIAVTMMSTLDVLQHAVAGDKNLVITHEPTFYGHLDGVEELERGQDAVFALKQEFIKKHDLIIWRFHDHWHLREPDGILSGMVKALGWERYRRPSDDRRFIVPEITLNELAREIQQRLGISTMRVVGDAALEVSKLALSPGCPGFESHRLLLQNDDVEVLVIGEAREWETIAYAYDAVQADQKKALIILGHVLSEQAGMEECAHWLRTFVTGLSIEFIPTPEPFWRPVRS
jgi:putative NIF3 family GTP cyclohydrolase 1 type 2